MNIFSSIINKIFQSKSAMAQSNTGFAPTPSGSSENVKNGVAPEVRVDAVALLSEMAKKKDQKLNWRESIVDLMKLLDLDSSLSARTALAKELHYSGDLKDSAKMNVWLQSEVMERLAKNGGNIPGELVH